MLFKDLEKLKAAVNEQLEREGSPFLLGFMTQHNKSRITIELGTPQQLKEGRNQKSLAFYLTRKEAALWLQGWQANAAIRAASTAPTNQRHETTLH